MSCVEIAGGEEVFAGSADWIASEREAEPGIAWPFRVLSFLFKRFSSLSFSNWLHWSAVRGTKSGMSINWSPKSLGLAFVLEVLNQRPR